MAGVKIMRTTQKQGRRGNPAWKKGGSSPNPGGRPKSKNYAAAARKWLDENADELIAKHGAAALGRKPDLQAARLIIEYAEGKAKQSIDVSIEDRKRQLFENAVESLMVETGAGREEAVAQLLAVVPEASQWIN